jgi:hypothetical protein
MFAPESPSDTGAPPQVGLVGRASARQLPEHHQTRRAEARPTSPTYRGPPPWLQETYKVSLNHPRHLHPTPPQYRFSAVTGKSVARIRISCASGLEAHSRERRIPASPHPVRGCAQGVRAVPCHPFIATATEPQPDLASRRSGWLTCRTTGPVCSGKARRMAAGSALRFWHL